MKTSTLHKIARHIYRVRGIVERRTNHEMTDVLEWHAGEATSKREAAYIIMTEVFEMQDDPDEDRPMIDRILSDFPGTFTPTR